MNTDAEGCLFLLLLFLFFIIRMLLLKWQWKIYRFLFLVVEVSIELQCFFRWGHNWGYAPYDCNERWMMSVIHRDSGQA